MRALITLAAIITLTACGSDGPSDPYGNGGNNSVNSVTISPPNLAVAVGATGTFTATALNVNSSPLSGKTFTWSSNNSNIASVTGGVVTGVAVGNTTITATSEGKSQNAAVTVTAPGVTQAVFSDIAPGHHHACAINAGGKAYCWGSDQNGQLGTTATTGLVFTPTAVTTGLTFNDISSGYEHTCALTTAGNAHCWGWGMDGQLGDGTNLTRDLPVAVNTQQTFTSISATSFNHTCALTATGVAYCWGSNIFGQLGDGTTTPRSSPVAVSNPPAAFTSISVGARHTCALTTAQRAYCWGDAQYVGKGTLTGGNPTTPTEIIGGRFYKSLVAGWWSACGITTNDATYCWGLYNNSTNPTLPPTLVPSVTFTQLAPSNTYVCGIVAAGGSCFGANPSGALGDGTSTPRPAPVAVNSPTALTKIFTGNGVTCGLTATNLAFCWGLNSSGQGGVGHQLGNLTPTAVIAPIN